MTTAWPRPLCLCEPRPLRHCEPRSGEAIRPLPLPVYSARASIRLIGPISSAITSAASSA